MADKTYSVFNDALIPVQRILSEPFNVVFSEIWMKGKINTYKAISELEKHSVLWDLSEIKNIYSLINYHIYYQNKFSCEILFRDGFDGNIKEQKFENSYRSLTRQQILFMALLLCDDVLFEDISPKYVTNENGKFIITTENYTMKFQNPVEGMPGICFEFKAGELFELRLFAYKS